MVKGLALALTLAGPLLVAGCGDDGDGREAARKGTYVGKVADTNVYVALTSDGERLGGYLCDGTPKRVSAYLWLDDSAIAQGRAKLVTRTGKAVGEATLDGERASGKIEVAGKSQSFDAELASGDAGLYRAAEDGRPGIVGKLEAAWIVLPDGSQRGASAPWTDPDPQPVVPKAAPRFTGQTTLKLASVTLRPQPWVDPDPSP